MLQACWVQQNQMGNHRNWSFSGWITFLKSICVCDHPRKLLMSAAVSLEHHQRVAGHFAEATAADLQCWVCKDTHLSSPRVCSLDPQEKLAPWKSKHCLLPLSSWKTAQKFETEISTRRVFVVMLYDSMPHCSNLVERLLFSCNCKSSYCSLTFYLQEQMHWNRTLSSAHFRAVFMESSF